MMQNICITFVTIEYKNNMSFGQTIHSGKTAKKYKQQAFIDFITFHLSLYSFRKLLN